MNYFNIPQGTAGDGLGYHNGSNFTTKDRDNDVSSKYNCAIKYTGAWWFKNCVFRSNLNGSYKQITKGMVWYPWGNTYNSMKTCKMMIRPVDY